MTAAVSLPLFSNTKLSKHFSTRAIVPPTDFSPAAFVALRRGRAGKVVVLVRGRLRCVSFAFILWHNRVALVVGLGTNATPTCSLLPAPCSLLFFRR